MPFAAGQMTARTSDNCLIAMLKLHYKIMAAALFGCIYDIVVTCTRVAHADIIHDSLVKQIVILRYIGYIPVVFIHSMKQSAPSFAAVTNLS